MSIDTRRDDTRWDVAIAGGGIVGAACLLACAKRGLKAVLVERDRIGGGATAAGMGHVVVLDDSEAQFALSRYSQELWHRLAVELPAAAEYSMCGTLWVAADEEEMQAAEAKHARYAARSVDCRLINAEELRALEPNLAAGLAGGLLVSDDAIVNSPVAAMELVRQAEVLGSQALVGTGVRAIGDGSMSLEDGTEMRADWLVNALGSEAARLSPGIAVRKRKGHLVITDLYPGLCSRQIVELGYLKSAQSESAESVAFNVQPRASGQLLIGSSRQYGAEESGVDAHIIAAMLARAARFLPALEGLKPVHARAGFRAATPDKLPLIGADPLDASVLLATGHEGLGITTSLATAEMIADLITGHSSVISREPYSPLRFTDRDSE